MLEDGKLAQIDELSNLGFGRSIATLPNGQPVLGQEQDELSSMLFDTSRSDGNRPSLEAEDGVQELEDPELESEEESELEIPPEPEPKRLASSPARRGLKLPRPTYALAEINGNHQPQKRTVTNQSADSGVAGLDGSVDSEVEEELLKDRPRSRIPRQVSGTNQQPIILLTSCRPRKKTFLQCQHQRSSLQSKQRPAKPNRRGSKKTRIKESRQTLPGGKQAAEEARSVQKNWQPSWVSDNAMYSPSKFSLSPPFTTSKFASHR